VPVPYDPDSPGSPLGAYFTAVVDELKAVSSGTVFGIHGSEPVGTLFDLLGYDKNVLFAIGDVNELGTLVKWVARWPDLLTSTLATIAAQTQAPRNTGTQRREIIAAAVMSGLLNGIQGTPQPSGPPQLAVTAGVSYEVGAVGWPDSGIPGTALEIALHPDVAFTFIQNQLLNGVFAPNLRTQHLLLGYLSVRVCQPTRTLMGMQQFAPYSVMVELVGYRSPEAVAAMKAIQGAVLNWNANQPSVSTAAMLHWGLENDQLTAASLLRTPLGGPAPGAAGHPPPSKVDRFRAVRSLLAAGTPSTFENAFVARLGL
jgi:hypothetical protein